MLWNSKSACSLVSLFAITAIFLCLIAPIMAQREEAAHVHILLVADTRGDDDRNGDGKGDLGLDLDAERMEKLLKEALNQQGMQGRWTIKILEGDTVNNLAILHYYRTLNTGPNDTLVFYYTGHGSFDRNDGHELVMRGKIPTRLLRSDLIGVMMRHNPRAAIVLTDCCANADAPILAGGARRKAPEKRVKLDGGGGGKTVRDLLFRTRGLVNITAARTGTWAQGNRKKGGSYFTLALAKLLDQPVNLFDKDRNKLVEWHEFFPFLEVQTEVESLSILQSGNLRLARFHTPEAFCLPGNRVKRAAMQPLVDLQKNLNAGGILLAQTGHLKSTDPIYAARRTPHHSHLVNLTKGETYSIELRSAEFDTYLYVEDARGSVVASNDDFQKDTTYSHVDFEPEVSGQYRIVVTTYNDKQTGKYSLTVRPYAHFTHGTLAKSDPLDHYCVNAHFKVHPVRLVAGQTYNICLESDKLDCYLRIEDVHGSTIALDDDSAGNLNSLLYFTPRYTDTYYLIASTFREGATGNYTLKIKR